jgi:hypothetical protein
MAFPRSQDILLPSDEEATPPVKIRVAAFVPIALAILGVAAIMLGRVTVAEVAASEAPKGVDPIFIGTVATTAAQH